MNEIDEYIRANRGRYTREAITQQLCTAGHDPADVEAAWVRVAEAPREAPARQEAGVGTTLLAVLLALGYGAAILLALWATQSGGAVTVLMVAYIAAMIGGGIWSIRRVLRAPSLGEGASGIALAAGISVVVFIGLSGACFALLGPAITAGGGIG